MSLIAQHLAAFRRTVEGKFAVGNTAGNRGECVGLVEVWLDFLGMPHVWGNAKDLLANAPLPPYRVFLNQPTNFPEPGDVVVWGDTWGGGYGHTGIAVTAAVMEMTIFQQNDPQGSTPHIKLYGYGGVKGWLRPKVGS
jgi:CHAP domain-containing protein